VQFGSARHGTEKAPLSILLPMLARLKVVYRSSPSNAVTIHITICWILVHSRACINPLPTNTVSVTWSAALSKESYSISKTAHVFLLVMNRWQPHALVVFPDKRLYVTYLYQRKYCNVDGQSVVREQPGKHSVAKLRNNRTVLCITFLSNGILNTGT
jgi:hypothetical protein